MWNKLGIAFNINFQGLFYYYSFEQGILLINVLQL